MSQPKDQWETGALGKDAPKGATLCKKEQHGTYKLQQERNRARQKKQATVQVCKMNKLINNFTSWHKTKKALVRWSSTPKDLGWK